MENKNSLSRVKRHDGSYFFIIELGLFNGLYKYVLANWEGKKIGEPMLIYSHTKRSSLNDVDTEFFDNNLLLKNRLNRYINEKNNLYIGGINRIQKNPVREYKEQIEIKKDYKTFIRNDNFILIELLKKGEINSYNIHEFFMKDNQLSFETSKIYTEKDLLNMDSEETDYVINNLLDKKRIEEKIKTTFSYIGTVEKINGEFKKLFHENNLKKIQELA